jgi:hypothetical protein
MNTINKNGIELSVHASGGRPMRIYQQDDKFFLESREDTEYTIEIKNNSSSRVEAVVAVDGLSVMNGATASYSDRGYIIEAWGKIAIKGYRKDSQEVGAFKFTKKEKSYAASKGDASNTGVIALAVYKEKYVPAYSYGSLGGTSVLNGGKWWINDYNPTLDQQPVKSDLVFRSATASYSGSTGSSTTRLMGYATNTSSFNSASQNAGASNASTAQSVSFDHGTTWGQKIKDSVTTTLFTRDSTTPFLVQEVFYNSKQNLENMGIKLVEEKLVSLPTGFPAQYATPPANWQG